MRVLDRSATVLLLAVLPGPASASPVPSALTARSAHRRRRCPGRGRPAPVMQQQSISLRGCAPNAWPLDGELGGVRR